MEMLATAYKHILKGSDGVSKEKVTRKFLKDNYVIINAGNGDLQSLLKVESPRYYCTKVEGWALDAYIFGDYAIIDGDSIGNKLVPIEIRRKYDNKASEIWNKYFYGKSKYYTMKRCSGICRKLINDFIAEVSG